MTQRPPDSLVFQVDLWSAQGELPRNLAEVATRQKEIQYSSRTRAFTDYLKHVNKLRNMLATLLEELPEEMKQKEEVKFLSSVVERHAVNIVQLIYRPKGYEGDSRLRVLASLHGGTLAGRLLRRRARTLPSRNF